VHESLRHAGRHVLGHAPAHGHARAWAVSSAAMVGYGNWS
jgi:hypothetical protein